MTLAIAAQRIHVADSNGNPIVGGKLYIYTAGTTTLASIYSDDGLSVSLPNPLSGVNASDASGYFPRAYLAAGTYKLRAVTAADVLIWQDDNIDTGLPAGTGALPISRGGTGATTAAAARAALDVPSNSELTALATQITTLQTALQGVVSAPQGVLTLTSGVRVIAADVIAATAVYYTPDTGSLVPIYDGSQFNPVVFTELTLTLSSNHLASTIYDVFVAKDSGTPILGTGPAWNNSTAGSGSRGTGGGTTELESLNGIWVNKNAITLRNGATLYSVAARQATFVGSQFMDGTNGQISCYVSWGQSRKWGISNAYNKRTIEMLCGDATASWTQSGTIRASNADSNNKITSFTCLPDERVFINFIQKGAISANASVLTAENAIGVNSTTVATGQRGTVAGSVSSAAVGVIGDMHARHTLLPAIGINNIQALDGAFTLTAYGTSAFMTLSARYAA